MRVLLVDDEWRNNSDKWISNKCAVSNHLVARTRSDLDISKSPVRTGRRILDLRGGGMSYDRIAKQLNADGMTGKAGGKFYASTVHKIVGNDLHA